MVPDIDVYIPYKHPDALQKQANTNYIILRSIIESHLVLCPPEGYQWIANIYLLMYPVMHVAAKEATSCSRV